MLLSVMSKRKQALPRLSNMFLSGLSFIHNEAVRSAYAVPVRKEPRIVSAFQDQCTLQRCSSRRQYQESGPDGYPAESSRGLSNLHDRYGKIEKKSNP